MCSISHEVSHSCIRIPQGSCIQKLSDGFLSRWQFSQRAGALDGTQIPILAPTKTKYNRKRFHSVVMQASVIISTDTWIVTIDDLE